MKKLLSFILTLAICLGLGVTVSAVETDAAEQRVYDIVEAMNANDWDRYLSYIGSEDYAIYHDFFANSDNEANYNGIFTVQSASLAEIYPIDLEEADKYSSVIADGGYEQFAAFLVGIDFTVHQESKYFFNGVNYSLIILGSEEGEWKLLQMSDAPLDHMVNGRSVLSVSSDMETALAMIENRKRGIYTNAAGDILEINGGNEDQSTYSDSLVPPSSIRVYMTGTGTVVRPNFTSYIKDVLPNEWYASWPNQSLRAGAMAVKTYGWYCTLYPEYESLGADVKDTIASQHYVPGSNHPNSNQAVMDTGGIGMMNSSRNIFRAEYRAGSEAAGNQHSGTMWQFGTKYWANQGKGFWYMCDYYYSYSSRSTGAIQTFIIGNA